MAIQQSVKLTKPAKDDRIMKTFVEWCHGYPEYVLTQVKDGIKIRMKGKKKLALFFYGSVWII